MTLLLISLVLLLPYSILIIYYRQGWLACKIYAEDNTKVFSDSTFISVIIVARNEEKNIKKCISSLINQTYPPGSFEIILVDDHSSDATSAIANSFKKDNIRVINLDEYTLGESINSYKKKGVEIAIGLAKGTLIVTTDADCIAPSKWLSALASFYKENEAVFIAAPVVYKNALPNQSFFKKLLINFQVLDFMTLQGITCGSVYKKIHNMSNGANQAYEKKVFNEVDGFKNIDIIASGDDMLLMHKIEKKYPGKISYLKSVDAIIETEPAETVKEFLNQRIRWASKADKYPDVKITAVLVLVYLLNAWIFLIGIFAFFYLQTFYLFLLLIVIKTSVELFFLYPVAVFFGKQQLLKWFIPAQPFHIVYTLIAGWLGKFGSYKWKGRKVE